MKQVSADRVAADATVNDTSVPVKAVDRVRESVARALRLVGPPESATERTSD